MLKEMTARSEYDLDVLAAEVIQCYRRVTLRPALPLAALYVEGSPSPGVSFEGEGFANL